MRRPLKNQRGAASVEAALSMIIIVPVFLYSLFLDDLLRYAADLQEAVLSTPWDFTGQNYAPTKRASMNPSPNLTGGLRMDVQHFAREMFCDHESSGDSYDRATDCDLQTHHDGHALAGHVCWVNPQAEQVTCDPVKGEVGLLADKQFRQYKAGFADDSGMYECHGKEVVENYLMPKTFLQKFSRTKQLSKENWKSKGTDYHANSEAGRDDTAYYLEKQHFALVADSWALNGDLRTAVPGDSLAIQPKDTEGDLYDRVEKSYTGSQLFKQFADQEKSFNAAVVSKQLLSDGALFDNRTKPHVSLSKSGGVPTQAVHEEGGKAVRYFNSPWKDGARDAYERTSQARGSHYMGCKTEGC